MLQQEGIQGDKKGRRAVLALMAGGGMAAIPTLVSPVRKAEAGHDASNVFHLGEENIASSGATTELETDVADTDGLRVKNVAPGGTAMRGVSENPPGLGNGTGVLGVSGAGAGISGFSESGAAVRGQTQQGAGGRFESESGAGVLGYSQTSDGAAGVSQSGAGGSFQSQDGPGVVGTSENGTGGEFRSPNGLALHVDGGTSFGATIDNHAFHFHNEGTGLASGTIRALGSGQKPVILAESDNPDSPAIVGASSGPGFGEAGQFAEGNGIGVAGTSKGGAGVEGTSHDGPGVTGLSQAGPGVLGHSPSGTGVSGSSQTGTGVIGSSDSGTGVEAFSASSVGVYATTESGEGVHGEATSGHGVMALSQSGIGLSGNSQTGTGVIGGSPDGIGVQAHSDNGVALDVHGRSVFTTAGSGIVPAGANAAFVAHDSVNASSHITVSLTGNPGSRQLQWIQRDPGLGFTVHLTSAPPPQRPQTPFTYLITETP